MSADLQLYLASYFLIIGLYKRPNLTIKWLMAILIFSIPLQSLIMYTFDTNIMYEVRSTDPR